MVWLCSIPPPQTHFFPQKAPHRPQPYYCTNFFPNNFPEIQFSVVPKVPSWRRPLIIFWICSELSNGSAAALCCFHNPKSQHSLSHTIAFLPSFGNPAQPSCLPTPRPTLDAPAYRSCFQIRLTPKAGAASVFLPVLLTSNRIFLVPGVSSSAVTAALCGFCPQRAQP